jgi:hypothetical protein
MSGNKTRFAGILEKHASPASENGPLAPVARTKQNGVSSG